MLTNSTSRFLREILNHSLPDECSLDFKKCNVRMIWDRFLVIPATGHLIVLDLSSPTSPLVIVPMDDPVCNPVNIFLDDSHHQNSLWVTCHGAETLFHLAFSVMLTDGGQVQIDKDRSRCHIVPDVSNISETLLVSADQSCNELRLYTVVESLGQKYVISFSIMVNTNPDLQHDHLENCEEVLYLEHQEGSTVFTVHCSDGSVTIETCPVTSLESHGNGVNFSCPEGNLVFTQENITLPPPSLARINHTFGAIKYGKCLGHLFVAIAADSSLNVVRVDTRTVTRVAESVCEGEASQNCVHPSFGPDSSFLFYDTAESFLKSVHVPRDCQSVAIVNYPETSSLQPWLMSVTGQAGSHDDCKCRDSDGKMTQPTIADEGVTSEVAEVVHFEDNTMLVSILVPSIIIVVLVIIATSGLVIFLVYMTLYKR